MKGCDAPAIEITSPATLRLLLTVMEPIYTSNDQQIRECPKVFDHENQGQRCGLIRLLGDTQKSKAI